MISLTKKLLIAASAFVSLGSVSLGMVAGAPAFASTLTNPVIGGTDYLLYGVNGNNTEVVPQNTNLNTILTGNAISPTGNIELFASSEKTPLSPLSSDTFFPRITALKNFLDFKTPTTLSGQLNGKNITLSSLTAADWFGTTTATSVSQAIGNALLIANLNQKLIALSNALVPLYAPGSLASTWFNTALTTYGASPDQTFFNAFLLAGGFQRFSDPNISYVNQEPNGLIRIGLAGHFDAASLLGLQPNPNQPLQASELVKVSYNGGPDQYLYSFTATQSGLTEKKDGKSHTGNYEVTLSGIPTQDVPEPSSVLGLVGLGGLFLTRRKLAKPIAD